MSPRCKDPKKWPIRLDNRGQSPVPEACALPTRLRSTKSEQTDHKPPSELQSSARRQRPVLAIPPTPDGTTTSPLTLPEHGGPTPCRPGTISSVLPRGVWNARTSCPSSLAAARLPLLKQMFSFLSFGKYRAHSSSPIPFLFTLSQPEFKN